MKDDWSACEKKVHSEEIEEGENQLAYYVGIEGIKER